jgi:hypothetical protein
MQTPNAFAGSGGPGSFGAADEEFAGGVGTGQAGTLYDDRLAQEGRIQK